MKTLSRLSLALGAGALSVAAVGSVPARGAGGSAPPGVTPIAEYWTSVADLQVVSIFSADDYPPIMELLYEWNDVFDITVYPAVSAERGLTVGPEVFARLPRLQP